MLFNTGVSVFSYCLYDLSMGEDVALESPTIIMLWSLCALQPNSIYFLKLYASIIGEKYLEMQSPPFLLDHEMSFHVSSE